MNNKSLFHNDWDQLLSNEIKKPYFKDLMRFVNQEYEKHKVYPPYEDIFNAFNYTPYMQVKVVIIGQDPYHQKGQANGLAFSVNKNVRIPKSLHNIFLELKDDLNISYPKDGDLTQWAKQGVLLLNTVLTVRDSHPGTHRNKGWETFTNYVISLLNKKKKPIVFLLWGNDAKSKMDLINNCHHLILTSVHPSPLSAYRGFFGCQHFSKTNDFLNINKMEPIDWSIKK